MASMPSDSSAWRLGNFLPDNIFKPAYTSHGEGHPVNKSKKASGYRRNSIVLPPSNPETTFTGPLE